MDHTLSMKTTKFMSIENLYKYGNRSLELDCSICINAVLLLTISLMILVLCMCIMVNFIILVIFTMYIINVIIITSVIMKPGAPACGWCTPVL